MHRQGKTGFLVPLKVLRMVPLSALRWYHLQRYNGTASALSADYSIFEYYLIPTIDFKQELLSMGANVEVITPQGLRDEIKNEIQEMSELYK